MIFWIGTACIQLQELQESLDRACAASDNAVKRKREAEKEEKIANEKEDQAHKEAYTLQLIKEDIEKLLKVCALARVH